MIKTFLLSFFCALFIAGSAKAQQFEVPRLTGPVMDLAGIIHPQAGQILSRTLGELYRGGGSQIQVLTVPSLEGLTIEQASIEVVEAWGLGRAKDDRAVLFMIALEERKIRIEVGYGLEGELTDLHASRIIREAVEPYFKAGNMTDGILVGVSEILKRTDPEFNFQSHLQGRQIQAPTQGQKQLGGGFTFIVYLILFVLLMVLNRGNPLFLLFLLGGMRGGGRRGGMGGGGFGGGGWSGGGGGFGGGGASGGW